MRRARLAALLLLVVAGATLAPVAASAAPPAAPACDPVQTAPVVARTCRPPTRCSASRSASGTSPRRVGHLPRAVDAASPRVAGGTLRDLRAGPPAALRGGRRPGNVSPAGWPGSAAGRRSATPRPPARRRPARRPDHAGDPVGRGQRARQRGERHRRRAAGALRARRPRDCAADRILDNAIVVLLPTQNPDGREADARRNAYGFDLNRDWFARTQPETDGKLQLLRQLPAGAVHRRARDGPRDLTSSRPTRTRSTTRSPTSRCTGSTTCTARR